MQRVTIEPTIATLIEVKPVGKRERRPIIFRAAEDWPGAYNLKVWNSAAKTQEFEMPGNALEVEGRDMTWWIDATPQALPAAKCYAEIYSEEFKAIVFKCEFEIVN